MDIYDAETGELRHDIFPPGVRNIGPLRSAPTERRLRLARRLGSDAGSPSTTRRPATCAACSATAPPPAPGTAYGCNAMMT